MSEAFEIISGIYPPLPKEAIKVAEKRPPREYLVKLNKGMPSEDTITVYATSDVEANFVARGIFRDKHGFYPTTLEFIHKSKGNPDGEEREAILKIQELASNCWTLFDYFDTKRFHALIIGAPKSVELEDKLKECCSTIENLQFLFTL